MLISRVRELGTESVATRSGIASAATKAAKAANTPISGVRELGTESLAIQSGIASAATSVSRAGSCC